MINLSAINQTKLTFIFYNYGFILFTFGFLMAITIILLLANYVIAPRKPDNEKITAYECGFTAFSDARSAFEIQFYLVAILYIIFDLELIFFLPWIIIFSTLTYMEFAIFMIFVAILLFAFIYELLKGAIDWR